MTLALLAVSAPPSSPPARDRAQAIGVVRVARGGVTLDGVELVWSGRGGTTETSSAGSSGRAAEAPVTHRALVGGAVLETSERGFVEVALGVDVRVRLSASTRLSALRAPSQEQGRFSLSLMAGRAWIQCARSEVEVATAGGLVRAGRGSSFVVEHTRTTGLVLMVRAGEAFLDSGGSPVRVAAREVATRATGPDAAIVVRPGGNGIGDLVTLEAERALGDWSGARAFLLEQAKRTEVAPPPFRGGLPSDADRAGADTGQGGALLEEAIRPPPFFEGEVPPKGPNVRVEVTFGEE